MEQIKNTMAPFRPKETTPLTLDELNGCLERLADKALAQEAEQVRKVNQLLENEIEIPPSLTSIQDRMKRERNATTDESHLSEVYAKNIEREASKRQMIIDNLALIANEGPAQTQIKEEHDHDLAGSYTRTYDYYLQKVGDYFLVSETVWNEGYTATQGHMDGSDKTTVHFIVSPKIEGIITVRGGLREALRQNDSIRLDKHASEFPDIEIIAKKLKADKLAAATLDLVKNGHIGKGQYRGLYSKSVKFDDYRSQRTVYAQYSEDEDVLSHIGILVNDTVSGAKADLEYEPRYGRFGLLTELCSDEWEEKYLIFSSLLSLAQQQLEVQ